MSSSDVEERVSHCCKMRDLASPLLQNAGSGVVDVRGHVELRKYVILQAGGHVVGCVVSEENVRKVG
jgi:hypothetical protein